MHAVLFVVAVVATVSIVGAVSACGGSQGTGGTAQSGGAASSSSPGGSADTDLRAERIVPFKMDQAAVLNVKVGPVTLHSVKFATNPRESFGDRFRSRPAKETETVVRASFDGENKEKDEWTVTFELTFLDKSGKTIDTASKKGSWEGEAKVFSLDNPILTTVVSIIDRVKILFEAKAN